MGRFERKFQASPQHYKTRSGKTSVLDVVTNPHIPSTSGSGRPVTEEQRVKGNLIWMEPEDFPDDIRAKFFSKKK
ncbi:MAG: hypothetical protein V1894_06660 [Chloroflexota bacterium]